MELSVLRLRPRLASHSIMSKRARDEEHPMGQSKRAHVEGVGVQEAMVREELEKRVDKGAAPLLRPAATRRTPRRCKQRAFHSTSCADSPALGGPYSACWEAVSQAVY